MSLTVNKKEAASKALERLAYLALNYGTFKDRDAIDVLENFVNKPRHVVGASVLITDGHGNVLLGKRNKDTQGGGLYSTPGGKVDLGENILDAAVREVKEECGIDISQYKDTLVILGHKQHHRYGDHSVIFYVYARITNAELLSTIRNVEPDKCDGWQWFSLSSIPKEPLLGIICTEPQEFIDSLYIRELED